jgi:hypothetical protein
MEKNSYRSKTGSLHKSTDRKPISRIILENKKKTFGPHENTTAINVSVHFFSKLINICPLVSLLTFPANRLWSSNGKWNTEREWIYNRKSKLFISDVTLLACHIIRTPSMR